jgi:excinuclease ABC subunit C
MLTKEMMADIPTLPGVYFFRDSTGKILYIGKAKSLRKRVRSYLSKSRKRPNRLKRLIHHAAQIRYEVCDSELEALLLESRLIKEHQPPYNRAMKGNRRDWFIKLDFNDDFPRPEVARETGVNGARYFGPFSSLKWTHEIIALLFRVFPIRTCEGPITPNPNFRPCLSYHLKRCDAPCAERVDSETYRLMLDDVCCLLEGNTAAVVASLVAQRNGAATELRFERAAALQKQIEKIKNISVFLDVHRR